MSTLPVDRTPMSKLARSAPRPAVHADSHRRGVMACMPTAIHEPALEARGLVKTFGEGPTAVRALRGVDLRVADGDFVAIMGPSGSGKSTLLHILGALDRPSGGSVAIHGRRYDDLP